MVLMQKGNELKYVADVHIESFRKNGYTVVGEEQPKKFGCPHCGKEYANGASLSRHIADKHKTNEE